MTTTGTSNFTGLTDYYLHLSCVLNALTQLVWHQEEHLACKKLSDNMKTWLSAEVQCNRFAHIPLMSLLPYQLVLH